MPETSTAVVVSHAPRSLMARFAERFQIEPDKLAATLKATAFATDKPITNEQLAMLVIVANQYNLNPFLRQIYAYPDRGRIVPVVGVDGWINLVQSHPQFDGWEFEWDKSDGSMTCTIYRKDRSVPTVVTEYLDECRRGTDAWKNMPRRMMRNRAIAQGARLAFGFTGIHTEEEAEVIVKGSAAAPDPESVTDTASRVKRAVRNEPAPIAIPCEEITDVDNPVISSDDFEVPSSLPAYLARIGDAENATECTEILEESLAVLNTEDYATLATASRAREFNPQKD